MWAKHPRGERLLHHYMPVQIIGGLKVNASKTLSAISSIFERSYEPSQTEFVRLGIRVELSDGSPGRL
jgi:hypothetical protein